MPNVKVSNSFVRGRLMAPLKQPQPLVVADPSFSRHAAPWQCQLQGNGASEARLPFIPYRRSQ